MSGDRAVQWVPTRQTQYKCWMPILGICSVADGKTFLSGALEFRGHHLDWGGVSLLSRHLGGSRSALEMHQLGCYCFRYSPEESVKTQENSRQ